MLKFAVFLILCAISASKSEDFFYNINSIKILHKVSDKFLSISLDPAVLSLGVNLSDVSLMLVKNLRPAYIQLAGPSTPFVKFLDHEEEAFSHVEQSDYVYITPSIWFGINEWFNLASLTPIFAINDYEREKGVWNSKSILPLLEMSDKFNVACYWQLGYDCSNKTTIQYVEDLNILKQTINDFPKRNETWKIVGADFSSCDPNNLNSHNYEIYSRDLDDNVDAIMWQGPKIQRSDLLLSKVSIWTRVSRNLSPITFFATIEYAIKVGEAAMQEYDVIFREPRLFELTHVTPIYWFSYLHKKLMGSNVLEMKLTNQNSPLTSFAHCTKRRNNLIRKGAITVMTINNGSETIKANIRLGNFLLETSMEIQSYFLSASISNGSDIFLNDKLLTMSMLQKAEDILTPKLHRAKIRPHISLEIPAQTIAFFVLTGAKFSLCVKNEEDTVYDNLDASLSTKLRFNIEERKQNSESLGNKMFTKGKLTLQNIKGNLLKETEQDKHYYKKTMRNPQLTTNILKQSNPNNKNNKKEILHKHLRAFIENSKPDTIIKENPFYNRRMNNLHLTIKEIEDILKRRAREKAAVKNIKLTSSELDMLIDKATLKVPKHFVSRRGINKILLEEKANFHQNNYFSQEMYEEIAKEMKMFPRFKGRKNHLLKRSINTQLLNLKAVVEENENYLKELNENLGGKRFSKTKRDINLDLLKKRTQSGSHFGSKIIVEPNLDGQISHVTSTEGHKKHDRLNGQSGDELLYDIMQFEEKTFKDIKEGKNPLADLEELNDKLFKHLTNRHSTLHVDQPITQPKTLQSSSDEFNHFADNNHKETPLIVDDDLGYLFPKSKYSNENEQMLWTALKSVQNRNNENTNLDYFNYFDDLDYGFSRKKRDMKTITQEKIRTLKKNVKNEIRKLKLQLTDTKLRYLKEKIKYKAELNKKTKSNIQIIPNTDLVVKPYMKNSTLEQIIKNANSKENIIEHGIKKRSAMQNELNNIFGKYTPFTSGLKSWKPADILNLHKNYFTTLPIYSWVQDQNLRMQYEINKNKLFKQLGLRKKRYIDINYKENKINNEVEELTNELNRRLETTTFQENSNKEQNDVIQRIPLPEKMTYLQKIFGTQKAKPVENFFNDVKEKFNDMNNKIKGFFKNLF